MEKDQSYHVFVEFRKQEESQDGGSFKKRGLKRKSMVDWL